MSDNQAADLQATEFTEFARQLYEWTKTLPEVQQGMLHRILARAASGEDDDSSGYVRGVVRRFSLTAFTSIVGTAYGDEVSNYLLNQPAIGTEPESARVPFSFPE